MKKKLKMTKDEAKALLLFSAYGLAVLVPVILKLAKIIDWAWGWVLAPIWLPVVVILVALLGVSLYMAHQYKGTDFTDIEE